MTAPHTPAGHGSDGVRALVDFRTTDLADVLADATQLVERAEAGHPVQVSFSGITVGERVRLDVCTSWDGSIRLAVDKDGVEFSAYGISDQDAHDLCGALIRLVAERRVARIARQVGGRVAA